MFELFFEAEGIDEMEQQLLWLEGAANTTVSHAVELLAKKHRKDVMFKNSGRYRLEKESKLTNADIIRYLAEQGRDFRDLNQGQVSLVAKRFLDNMMSRFKKVASTVPKRKPSKRIPRRKPLTQVQRAAKNAANYGLREAMKENMAQVTHNIDNAKWSGGGSSKLSESYAEYKNDTVGFQYPIGKFTGQLLDAINAMGPASRNISIKRK